MAATMVKPEVAAGRSGTTIRGRHKVRALSFWVATTLPPLAMSLAASSQAAEWKISPTVNLTETYTDNVRLLPDSQKQSSFITQLSPGLDVTAVGAQARMRINYQMQNLYYTGDANGVKTNHLLNADGNTELVKDLFFLDGKANVSQQDQSPFAATSTNNLNLSNNRVEVRTYSASPYLRHTFDRTASAEMRYTRDSVATSSTNGSTVQPNSTGDHVSLTVNSGAAFQKIKWGFVYDDQKTNFNNALKALTSETTGVNFGYYLSPRFSLTATTGYEKNNYLALDGKNPAGAYWSAGFDWEPTERTSLVLNAGHRFYGASYGLAATQRTRATAWNLGYHEDITTTRQQFLVPGNIDTSNYLNQLWKSLVPDPAARQQLVDAFIRNSGLPSSLATSINTFSNQVFLQKSLQGSVAITGAQNTVLISLFNTRRNAQSVALGAADPSNPNSLTNVKQTGANALWNLVFSPRTSANFSLGYNRVDSGTTGVRDNNKTFRAAISRDLQPKLKATLEYRRNQKDSSLSVSDFRENALSVFLLLGF
ncbi:MAG: TIGR03016 family PEP-CTERM system-associated outer membrane protein [Pseudomonadota bacterium]